MDYKKVPEAISELISSVNLQLKKSEINDIPNHPLTIATFFTIDFLVKYILLQMAMAEYAEL